MRQLLCIFFVFVSGLPLANCIPIQSGTGENVGCTEDLCDEDRDPCTIDTCVEEEGVCTREIAVAGTDCEGTLFCRDGETCNGEGECDPESGVPHCAGVCNEEEDYCE